MPMRYEGNPKHKEPWQAGRKGSLCPSDIDSEQANALLQASIECGRQRYSVHPEDGRPFCAQRSDEDGDVWHGYPVGLVEVPESVWRQWLQEKAIKKHHLRRFWPKDWHRDDRGRR